MDMPSPDAPFRIGTRSSVLAMAQARETRERLMAAHGLPEAAFELIPISTAGDRIQDRALREVGGKGLFTKEIEEAILLGRIDIAVHSTKDMPNEQPAGLVLDCFLPREDVRDGFVTLGEEGGLADLPEGAVVGTSSLRRRAQVIVRRPDLRVVEFRGNVQTRLRKLEDGVAAATFLAMAGLRRLGHPETARPIDPGDMLPAVAQGAIGIERREDDARARALLAPLHDRATGLRLAAERAFLARLDGSCETPIAGLADLSGDRLRLRGEILAPDGTAHHAGEEEGAAGDGPEMGVALAERLLSAAGPGFFDWRG
ncbi:hydroxymethylbilane synthase [Hasllibacter halocynthiae]|uniref:Porphobilinogen deaminase n=1 Tax=Hasllibacter halocynthiae TaxID=595589 RepID=A0A2T0X436_9RHOB|nr:hydroxymethylbilane synthase [Hasllibacter halocynthiae]PRY93701.1 hydroxymethylbilane synthase [Hasllibacter halocynthiae]